MLKQQKATKLVSFAEAKLTTRELEIVSLVLDGYRSIEIAGHLHISIRTVEAHRYNILKKFNIKNSYRLVNYLRSQPVNQRVKNKTLQQMAG